MRLNPTSFSGTDYTIIEFPRPALRRVPNAPIVLFDKAFETITQQMINIMYQGKGVGLAAPQIGINQSLFVYNPTADRSITNMQRIVCNPKITQYSDEIEVQQEGCLSMRSDDCAGQVARSLWIHVHYQNELGQKVTRRLKGFEARVFQHEYDHLNGILCYDRFPPEDRKTVHANIQKLLGLYTEDDALVDPDSIMMQSMQPRPLTAKRMPPLGLVSSELQENALTATDGADDKKAKQAPTNNKSGGFGGAGGFGGGGGGGKSGTKVGKKKDKKKKVKVRNGNFSSNPTFK